MATEFNDAEQFAVGSTAAELNTQTGLMFRWSEIVLASLRSAGVLDNMVDSTTAPEDTTAVWLDKNSDPAAFKRYDAVNSAWVPATLEWFLGNLNIPAHVTGASADTAAVDAAFAKSINVDLQPGQTYRYAGSPPYDMNLSGGGKLVYEEDGQIDQVMGKIIFVGSHQGLGGENRAFYRGGVMWGDPDERRGIQGHVGQNHAWMFFSERSGPGSSMLFTLAPNARTVNGTITAATDPDRIVAGVNTFANAAWATDALVFFGGGFYRISGKASDGSWLDIVNDDTGRTAVTFTEDMTDNCILPLFFWDVKANVSDTALTIISGEDVPPIFSAFDYNNDRVMAYIDGSWTRITSQTTAADLTLEASRGTLSNVDVRIINQPRYAQALAIKWASGGGLEQTARIETAGDGMRIVSSGSGVGANPPMIFQVGDTDVARFSEALVRILEDTIVEKLTVNGNLLTNLVRPEAADVSDIGTGNFPYRNVYANQIRIGSAGSTVAGASGSFTAQSGETVTVAGGIITDIT